MLELGHVWVFVQLIHRPTQTNYQLYKTQTLCNLRLPISSGYECTATAASASSHGKSERESEVEVPMANCLASQTILILLKCVSKVHAQLCESRTSYTLSIGL